MILCATKVLVPLRHTCVRKKIRKHSGKEKEIQLKSPRPKIDATLRIFASKTHEFVVRFARIQGPQTVGSRYRSGEVREMPLRLEGGDLPEPVWLTTTSRSAAALRASLGTNKRE